MQRGVDLIEYLHEADVVAHDGRAGALSALGHVGVFRGVGLLVSFLLLHWAKVLFIVVDLLRCESIVSEVGPPAKEAHQLDA